MPAHYRPVRLDAIPAHAICIGYVCKPVCLHKGKGVNGLSVFVCIWSCLLMQSVGMYAVRDRRVVVFEWNREIASEREKEREGRPCPALRSLDLWAWEGNLSFVAFHLFHPSSPPPFYWLNRIQPGLCVPHTATIQWQWSRRKRERQPECDREKYSERKKREADRSMAGWMKKMNCCFQCFIKFFDKKLGRGTFC